MSESIPNRTNEICRRCKTFWVTAPEGDYSSEDCPYCDSFLRRFPSKHRRDSGVFKLNTYEKCRKCDELWVTAQDEHCPYCGMSEPYKEKERKFTTNLFVGLLNVLGIFIVMPTVFLLGMGLFLLQAYYVIDPLLESLISRDSMSSFRWGKLRNIVAIIVSLIESGIIVWAWNSIKKRYNERKLKKEAKEMLAAAMRSNSCLLKDGQIIREREWTLDASEQRILSARELVESKMTGERKAKLLDMFEKAEALIHEQRKRCRLHSWMIGLITWRNKIAPLEADLENLSESGCNRRLHDLAELIAEGEHRQKGWDKYQAELASPADSQSYITQVRKTLVQCKQLHDDLITQRSVLATKDVGPVNAMSPDIGTKLQYLDMFNTHTDIEQYSRSFRPLEDEYTRLEFDVETARHLKELEKDRLLPQ